MAKGGECLADEVFAQMLVSKGYSNIVWDPYTCKSHKCLIERKNNKGYCKDCFDLQEREKGRWIFDDGGLDFGIDRVLGTKRSASTISIGLDIGGGTGTFAARMKERNVTIITSTLDLDGPFSNFIASRRLIPIHLSISQRLLFFENTLDIVHFMEFIGNWLPETMLEFLLYDVYRVLRPGGIFWLEHFFCFGSQVNGTYLPMFDRVGFNRLRWHAGRKLDHDGIQKNEWYISALLEKPVI
ncbi:probable methyltransferase At1g29790 [Arachis stenosperma]|uniref:probable methyltransferase At1g29790 n=1 Tax=Arachis stenosperma TaxID=217475 RepID=UPI0025AB9EFD|nr:probable methyltransferase At1g29790 [Arachis stenosperma]